MTSGDTISTGGARFLPTHEIGGIGTFGSCRLSPWRNFPKAVSHTIERNDHVECIVDSHELLTHSFNATINCTFGDVNVIGICRIP
jgi:hypothetical protein